MPCLLQHVLDPHRPAAAAAERIAANISARLLRLSSAVLAPSGGTPLLDPGGEVGERPLAVLQRHVGQLAGSAAGPPGRWSTAVELLALRPKAPRKVNSMVPSVPSSRQWPPKGVAGPREIQEPR